MDSSRNPPTGVDLLLIPFNCRRFAWGFAGKDLTWPSLAPFSAFNSSLGVLSGWGGGGVSWVFMGSGSTGLGRRAATIARVAACKILESATPLRLTAGSFAKGEGPPASPEFLL